MNTLETMRAFYNSIFDVLAREAGASENIREDYVFDGVRRWQDGLGPFPEWSFRGRLGHGGKIRCRGTNPLRFTVDCYHEDETFERIVMIERTNNALSELCAKATS